MELDVILSHTRGKTIYIIIDGVRRLGRLKSGERYASVGDGSLTFCDVHEAALALDPLELTRAEP